MTRPLPTPRDHLLQRLTQGGGYLTGHEASAAGIPSMTLTRLLESGEIERPQRGVYRLAHTDALPPAPLELLDLLEIQLRFPPARPCLVSALHLHGLTTTRPAALQIAVPANRRPPNPDSPALEVFFFSPKFYESGVTTLTVRGRTLTTYTVEKTLTDLLRFAPRFGRELYLEGLKNYLPNGDRPRLVAAAKAAGVWRELSRDLEVLGHDQDH